MKKYLIITHAVCDFEYEVEADTEAEATNKWYDGEYQELADGKAVDYHNETVKKVEILK
tara:strand:- start:518 stop:694 length:177 start_codon:yes stop_codon:yes gene_type:complete